MPFLLSCLILPVWFGRFVFEHLRYKTTYRLFFFFFSETCGGTLFAVTVRSSGWSTGWRRPTLLFLPSTVPPPLSFKDAESTTSHRETSTALAQVSLWPFSIPVHLDIHLKWPVLIGSHIPALYANTHVAYISWKNEHNVFFTQKK